jgi:hypothetical protein
MADPATLDSIEDALFAALAPLAGPAPKPFRLLARYTGEITQDLMAEVCNGRTPAVLLGLETDTPIAGSEVETLDAGLVAQDSRAVWRVLVVLEDPRGEAKAAKPNAARRPGYLGLIEAARGALNGLPIEGLVDAEVAHFTGARKERVDPGKLYVHSLRFRTDYPVDVIAREPGGAPFEGIIGSFDSDVDFFASAAITPDPAVVGQTYGVTVNGTPVSHTLGAGEGMTELLTSLALQLFALGLFVEVTATTTTITCTRLLTVDAVFTAAVKVAVASCPNPPLTQLRVDF